MSVESKSGCRAHWCHLFMLACLWSISSTATAEQVDAAREKTPPQILELADGKLRLPVPGDWRKVEPRSSIVEYEFAVSATDQSEQAKPNGRVTLMRAGGSVEANIDRWRRQFTQPKDASQEVEQLNVEPLTVHIVDLSGVFHDRPRGPFGPSVDREDYRMLAAIIESPAGNVFIKFYGPKATVNEHTEAFRAMLEGIQWSNS